MRVEELSPIYEQRPYDLFSLINSHNFCCGDALHLLSSRYVEPEISEREWALTALNAMHADPRW